MKASLTWPNGRPRSKTVMETKQTPRRQRMTAREKTLKALQDNTARSIVITKQADADRSARIRGR